MHTDEQHSTIDAPLPRTLSLREYYAGIALASMAASVSNSGSSAVKTNIWKPEHIADKAVQLADAMLQRLARR